MAKYPKAQFVGADPHNFSTNKITPKFIVIHVESGTESGTNAWFHNPKAQVSAHFGIGKDGTIYQFVDTDQTAWAEAELNGVSISIEHEGLSGQHLTAKQIEADKGLIQWIHDTYNIPLVLTFNQNDPHGGVLPHGKINEGAMSHPDCPGQPIIDDIHALLNSMVPKA